MMCVHFKVIPASLGRTRQGPYYWVQDKLENLSWVPGFVYWVELSWRCLKHGQQPGFSVQLEFISLPHLESWWNQSLLTWNKYHVNMVFGKMSGFWSLWIKGATMLLHLSSSPNTTRVECLDSCEGYHFGRSHTGACGCLLSWGRSV